MMDEKTLTALKGSIAKWEAIVAKTGDDKGAKNCPLCQLFNTENHGENECCIGCPVHAHTGKRWCNGTPYRGHPTPESSRAELDFLKSLLPANPPADTEDAGQS